MTDEPTEPGTPNPPRLRHDRAFRAQTGCDLADEGHVDRAYDHDKGRRRLLAAIAALPPPGGAPQGPPAPPAPPTPAPVTAAGGVAAKVAVGVGGGVALALAFVAGTWFGAELPPAPAPTAQSAPRIAPDELPLPPPGDAAPVRPAPDVPAAAPAEPAAPRGATAAPPRDPPAPLPPEPTAAVEPPASLPSAPVAPVAPERGASAQTEYLAFLEGGNRHRDGDYAGARDAFRAYLASYPQGTLEPEAQFGLLLALHQLGDAAATESLARTLQDRAVFSSRRPEIVRLRAESLVQLGRCDEALSLADQMASKDAAEVRRVCRSRRREEP